MVLKKEKWTETSNYCYQRIVLGNTGYWETTEVFHQPSDVSRKFMKRMYQSLIKYYNLTDNKSSYRYRCYEGMIGNNRVRFTLFG